jgi:hypothetical protein
MDTPDYRSFRDQLEFGKGFFLCYKCGVPHQPPFGRHKGGEGCTFHDILKLIAYVIFYCDNLRPKVFAKLQLSPNHFQSFDEYRVWLGQKQGHASALYNIHEIVLAYHELCPYGGFE